MTPAAGGRAARPGGEALRAGEGSGEDGRVAGRKPRPVADPWQALARSLARAVWEAGRQSAPPERPFPLSLTLTVTPGARWQVGALGKEGPREGSAG